MIRNAFERLMKTRLAMIAATISALSLDSSSYSHYIVYNQLDNVFLCLIIIAATKWSLKVTCLLFTSSFLPSGLHRYMEKLVDPEDDWIIITWLSALCTMTSLNVCNIYGCLLMQRVWISTQHVFHKESNWLPDDKQFSIFRKKKTFTTLQWQFNVWITQNFKEGG